MRVVLDTNLLLSALISSGSVPAQVYRAWEDGVFDLLTSEWQLEELRRASRYLKLRRYIKPHEAEMMVGGSGSVRWFSPKAASRTRGAGVWKHIWVVAESPMREPPSLVSFWSN